MAHVLYGTDRYLILEKANQLYEDFEKTKGKVEKLVFQTSDQGFELSRVREAIETISLFRIPKWIFLYVESDKDFAKLSEDELGLWFDYCTSDLEFVLALPKKPSTKSPFRKKIIKMATESTITSGGKDAVSVTMRVNQALRKHKVSMDDAGKQTLIARIGTNSARVENEIEKLKLLGRAVTRLDVEDLISFDLEQDVFALSNALLAKNHNEVFRIYHQLLRQKNDPLNLAPLIAASLRSMYQVSCLQVLNYSASDIRTMLGMSDGQYWNITNKHYQSKDSILEILNSLSTFDQESKMGLKDRFVSFEMLLLSIML